MTDAKIPDWAESCPAYYNALVSFSESDDKAINQAAREFMIEHLKTAVEPSPEDVKYLTAQITLRLNQINDSELTKDVQTLVWLAHPDMGSFYLSVFGRWDNSYLSPGKHLDINQSPFRETILFKELGGPFIHKKQDEVLGGGYFGYDEFEEFEGHDLADFHMEVMGAASDQRDNEFEEALKIAFENIHLDNPKIIYPIKNFSGDVTDGGCMHLMDFNKTS